MPTPKTHNRSNNKYCLPIVKSSKAEVLNEIKTNIDRYHYLEVWLDYVSDIDADFASSLVAKYPHRLIMVFRRLNLDAPKISGEQRFAILKTLARKQVLVDLDIASQIEDIKKIQAARIQIKSIISYHNYSLTPSDTELRSIVNRIAGCGAHIIKIATQCTIQRDALRLLSLLIDMREAGKRCIVLGMGKHGVITRVFGAKWGNEISFAPSESSPRSAPGQISIDKLESIMQALN
jgi:3-dehydroquinate dehydratase-1